jgi:hypothetical protein
MGFDKFLQKIAYKMEDALSKDPRSRDALYKILGVDRIDFYKPM